MLSPRIFGYNVPVSVPCWNWSRNRVGHLQRLVPGIRCYIAFTVTLYSVMASQAGFTALGTG